MHIFTWIVIIFLIGVSSQAGRRRKRLEELDRKLDIISKNQENFQLFMKNTIDDFKLHIENTLLNFTDEIAKHLQSDEMKNIKASKMALMSADEPMVEVVNKSKKINSEVKSQVQDDLISILKSMEKSIEVMHKKEIRRLIRLQQTLDKNFDGKMLMTAPLIKPDKEDESCTEIDKSIRKMSDNLERDHKDIQQGVNLLQHQMSLDMGSGLRAMQLDILQCTRSVTELHRSLLGMSKHGMNNKFADDHLMQQDEPSVFIFNRHPTPIGKTNDYLQEIPVPNMKVVSAVLNGRPRSCAEVYQKGFQKSGIFSIWPQFNTSARLQLYAYCDMSTEGGGWTVIQRRGDFGGEHENFTRLWSEYKRGFGHVSREFWFGLDPIYALTHQESVELRIEIEMWNGQKREANYNEFQLEDESDFYRLTIGNFTGDVEDCFSPHHNGVKFSTIDSNNAGHISRQCAKYQGEGGGWWYDNCYYVKLNSIYYPKGDVDRGQGIQWRCWSGYWYSLKHVEMKVRPLCFPDKCTV